MLFSHFIPRPIHKLGKISVWTSKLLVGPDLAGVLRGAYLASWIAVLFL